MDNGIRELHIIWDGRLAPAKAAIQVVVYPEVLTSSTQVRGRVTGPRCRFASTVEVAYSLLEQSRAYGKEDVPHILLRSVIPEANLWDPESPFLYDIVVELWQSGQKCDHAQLRRGLRVLHLGPRGLRWNGRLLSLRGAARNEPQESGLLQLRKAGCNLLIAPVQPVTMPLWSAADEFGFLMLGRITDKRAFAATEPTLKEHPGCLGWVWDAKLLEDPVVEAGFAAFGAADGPLTGIEVHEKPTGPLPENVHFLLCKENLLSALESITLPKIALAEATVKGPMPAATPGIPGWIYPL